jgi:maleylacetoacetate isomerase
MSGAVPYRLYHYWRSSSSWRVRLAFDWKGLAYETLPVSLLNGESEGPEHRSRNPAGFVPVLEIVGPPVSFLTESLAIIEYLEEVHPDRPTLLPGPPVERARIRALAEVINAGTQPIQNIPVMERHSRDPVEQKAWAREFIHRGLETYESLCSSHAGAYSVGDVFSLADVCLIPQVYNAERYQVDLRQFPVISGIHERCRSLPVYESSHPDRFKPSDFQGT